MDVDVDHHINAASRTVGARTLEAGEAQVVAISRTYDEPIEDVWEALTNVERIPRWFLPITGELRVGGRYQLEDNAGGVVERCEPPRAFDAAWEFGGGVSWIEVRLAEEGAGTRFTLTHIAQVDDETWEQYGPGATSIGWDGAVLGLTLHLATGAANDPAEAVAWSKPRRRGVGAPAGVDDEVVLRRAPRRLRRGGLGSGQPPPQRPLRHADLGSHGPYRRSQREASAGCVTHAGNRQVPVASPLSPTTARYAQSGLRSTRNTTRLRFVPLLGT